jgi:anti-sigma regulatory factor (Ser/Thr protein kinase)
MASSLTRLSSAQPSAVLRELIGHLRDNRERLGQLWVRRILNGGYLTAMSADEIRAETASLYDSYLEVLATGDIEVLEGYARDLSERIIPRGVQTSDVVGIVQEGLTNVIKHAQATQAMVRLRRRRDAVVCSVVDNGRGFDKARAAQSRTQGLGLIGMKERAAVIGGTLLITSAPGRGTTLKVVVPLKALACHPESSLPTTM